MLKLGGNTDSVRLQLRDGTRFKVRSLFDIWIVVENCLGHVYEYENFHIEKNWVVLDVGAGIGDFSIDTAKKCVNGRVYAFEPFAGSFELLQENIRINNIQNIVAVMSAVGAETKPMQLDASFHDPVLYSTIQKNRDTGDQLIVQGVGLDDAIKSLCGQICNLVKLDCEGAEFDIIFNASTQTIKQIERICLEYHDGMTEYNHVDLVRFLQDRNFSVVLKPNAVHKHTGLLFAYKKVCS